MLKRQFPTSQWDAAKIQVRDILRESAKKADVISYSELATGITAIKTGAHDKALHDLLCEVSMEELEQDPNGGIISALVVHKNPPMEPGEGFYGLASNLGRDISDRAKCWEEEKQRVYDHWANKHKGA